MTLIETLHSDMVAARINGDPVAKNLLITLYAEASRVGKDKRNGSSTDEEVISTIKKFIANAEETSKILKDRGHDNSIQVTEISILSKYMPKQLTREELENIVSNLIVENNASGPKAMGQIMGALKAKYSGTYDGKLASEIVKLKLS